MRKLTKISEEQLWADASKLAGIAFPEPPRAGSPARVDDPLEWWGLTQAIVNLAYRFAGTEVELAGRTALSSLKGGE